MLRQLVIFLSCIFVVFAQEYRCVPVCDDSGPSGGSAFILKGAKGSLGLPGKAGPQGPVGLSVKGDKGDPGNCNATLISLMAKLEETESRLLPASCLTSSVFGGQQLSSGKDAFCDNGWTVFQRRFDGSVDFNQMLEEYERGFGNLNGEFWLGLEKIHLLTHMRTCQLRVELESFDDERAFAVYRVFAIGSESDNYALRVDGYNNERPAGNSLLRDGGYHNNMQFTTNDRDNDRSGDNCASYDGIKGGWWYNKCFYASLNAQWNMSQGIYKNIIWYTWKGYAEALKSTTMKLKCLT